MVQRLRLYIANRRDVFRKIACSIFQKTEDLDFSASMAKPTARCISSRRSKRSLTHWSWTWKRRQGVRAEAHLTAILTKLAESWGFPFEPSQRGNLLENLDSEFSRRFPLWAVSKGSSPWEQATQLSQPPPSHPARHWPLKGSADK